nr:thioredoxin domain-containing protein [Blautia obeum]
MVDFWAPWCGYCRRIGSAYEKISEEYSDILIAGKVNIDEEPQIAEAEKIEILGLVHQYAASMLEKEKKVSFNRQCDDKEINTAELQKQSRQLTSEKMKLYDDYKDGRIDRDSYKQRAEKISGQLDEIKRKIEDAKNSKKLLEQNELSDKIKLKDFLGIQKFDTEKLREIIKVIRVHSQDEIEIEWNFDDIFSEQR